MNLQPSTIMVVDDTVGDRLRINELYKRSPYDVIESFCERNSIGIVRKREVEAVMLDVMLDEVEGYEICKEVRDTLGMRLSPVLMLTKLEGSKEVNEDMLPGATELACKPFNKMELKSCDKAGINPERLTERIEDTEKLLFSIANMVEARNKQTEAHPKRLYQVSKLIGREVGLTDEEIEVLRRGSILHDIGMIGVPESILLKEGKLTDEEWTVMKTHTIVGADLCSNLKSMKGVLDIIRYHHERWDGSGYPYALADEQIPNLVRIFQIADKFDTLISERPYRKGFPIEEVVRTLEMEADNGCLDPELVPIFLEILRTNPEELYCEGVIKMAGNL